MSDGLPNFITPSAIDYLETIPGGQGWVNMVKAYLRLEQLPVPQSVCLFFIFPDCVLTLSQCPLRLPTKSRPAEVGIWMKGRSYDAGRLPFVADTNAYGKSWVAWWTACQPTWRQKKGWPLPTEQGNVTNWGKLTARGQNGMFIVIMSTTWWAASLKPTDDRGMLDEAISDVRWVIEQILAPPPAPSTPNITQGLSPTPGIQEPAPVTATWLMRPDGKRQPKPSRKLLEGMK